MPRPLVIYLDQNKWVELLKAESGLMGELSNFVTVSPVQHLLCLEIESFLLRHYRWKYCIFIPAHVKSVFLGWGVNHAFNSLTGRFRFVETIAADDQPEGELLDAPVHLLELFCHAHAE